MDSEPKIITYAVNGEPQGVAYEISSEALGDKALFPHILSKNTKFSVSFSGEPAFPLLEGYTFCGEVPLEDRVAGPQRPESKEECEVSFVWIPVNGFRISTHWCYYSLYSTMLMNCSFQMIMMCGLPGCGKTFWALKHTSENPEKLYNILGTNNLIDKMKVGC